jgi:hypothetical protein
MTGIDHVTLGSVDRVFLSRKGKSTRFHVKQGSTAQLLSLSIPPVPNFPSAVNFVWPAKELLPPQMLASLVALPASKTRPSQSPHRRRPLPNHARGNLKLLRKGGPATRKVIPKNQNLQLAARNAPQLRKMLSTHSPL